MEKTNKSKRGRKTFAPGEAKKAYCTRLPPKLIAQLSGLPRWIKAARLIEDALIKTYPLYFGEGAGQEIDEL